MLTPRQHMRHGQTQRKTVKHATSLSSLWFQSDQERESPAPKHGMCVVKVVGFKDLKTATRCCLSDIAERLGSINLFSREKASKEELSKKSNNPILDQTLTNIVAAKSKCSLLSGDSGYGTANSVESLGVLRSPMTPKQLSNLQENTIRGLAADINLPSPTLPIAVEVQKPGNAPTTCSNEKAENMYDQASAADATRRLHDGNSQRQASHVERRLHVLEFHDTWSNLSDNASDDLFGLGAQFDRFKLQDYIGDIETASSQARLSFLNTASALDAFSLKEPSPFLDYHDDLRTKEVAEAQTHKRKVCGASTTSVRRALQVQYPKPSRENHSVLQVPHDERRCRSHTNSSGTTGHGSVSGSSNAMPSSGFTPTVSVYSNHKGVGGKRKFEDGSDEDEDDEDDRRVNGPSGVICNPNGTYSIPCLFHYHDAVTYCDQPDNDRYKTCEKRFGSTARLKQHLIEVHHLGATTCVRCLKRFKTPDLLTKHNRSENLCSVEDDEEILSCLPGTQRHENFEKREKKSRKTQTEKHCDLMYQDLFFEGHQCFKLDCESGSARRTNSCNRLEVPRTSHNGHKSSLTILSAPSTRRSYQHANPISNSGRAMDPGYTINHNFSSIQHGNYEPLARMPPGASTAVSVSPASIPEVVLTTPEGNCDVRNLATECLVDHTSSLSGFTTASSRHTHIGSVASSRRTSLPMATTQRGYGSLGQTHGASQNRFEQIASDYPIGHPLAREFTPMPMSRSYDGSLGQNLNKTTPDNRTGSRLLQSSNQFLGDTRFLSSSYPSSNITPGQRLDQHKLQASVLATTSSPSTTQNAQNLNFFSAAPCSWMYAPAENVQHRYSQPLMPRDVGQSSSHQYSNLPNNNTFYHLPAAQSAQEYTSQYIPDYDESIYATTNYESSIGYQPSSGQVSDFGDQDAF